MKLKYVAVVAGAMLLQACSTIPALQDTTKSLDVYPDNRVGFVLSDGRSYIGAHGWTNGNDVLALRFKDRLINAKDLESVETTQTRNNRTPLTISVKLRNGEFMQMAVADWGNSAYSDGKVEWVACTTDKVCEYLERAAGAMTPRGFPQHQRLVSVVMRGSIDERADRASKGAGKLTADGLETFDIANTLPNFPRATRMEFRPVDEVKDTESALQISYRFHQAWNACKKDKAMRDDAERQAYIDKVMRSNPSKRDLQLLEQWKRMNERGFLVQDMAGNAWCGGRVKVAADSHRATEVVSSR